MIRPALVDELGGAVIGLLGALVGGGISAFVSWKVVGREAALQSKAELRRSQVLAVREVAALLSERLMRAQDIAYSGIESPAQLKPHDRLQFERDLAMQRIVLPPELAELATASLDATRVTVHGWG